MRRRTYLIGGAAVVTTIAGCGSPGPGATETEPGGLSPETDGEPGATPTGMEDGTETEAEAGTETEAGSPTETEAGTPTEGMGETVEMVSEEDAFYFDPVGLAVEPGMTVEWSVTSGEHSSTAYDDRIPEDAEAWDSEVLSETEETTSQTFEAEGTYDYYCTVHQDQEMVGRIVVGEPGGPAEDDMPPDGDVPESQQIVDEGSVSYADFSAE